MNLNLQEKVILITQDNLGICKHIFDVLMDEGAFPIIIEKKELENLKQNRIDAFINITDPNNQNLFTTLYELCEFNYIFGDHFSVINLRDSSSLSLNLDTIELPNFKNSLISFEKPIKVNTIVFPKNENNGLTSDNKYQIANTSAFLLSNKSNRIGGQSIFIGGRLKIYHNNFIN